MTSETNRRQVLNGLALGGAAGALPLNAALAAAGPKLGASSGLARCVATRLGRGGQPGQTRPLDVRRFVVEFMGGPLTNLPPGTPPTLDLGTSRGTFTPYHIVEAVAGSDPGHWQAQVDLTNVHGSEPVEMQLTLMMGGKPVSETWTYQYHPF